MFTTNHFAELANTIPSSAMQVFVLVMIALVVGGTIFDVLHKRSGTYFFKNMQDAKNKAARNVGSGEKAGLAIKTVASEVLTSSEFCNPHRRVAHLLGMYGFVIYLVATVVMVFGYTGGGVETPAIWPILWALGALMVCIGGYWFWFFIRVDVAAEGNSVFRIVQADLFILSLLASCTFALIWAFFQSTGSAFGSHLFLGLYIIASVVLFAGIPWSKFAHMFFKPAAAYEKRISKASGYAQNLPTISRDDPEQRKRHSMELLQDAPMDMGLGIKREAPRHY